MVMDFVPNHSSDQHEWFKKSETKEGNYTDYYVWADAKGMDKQNSPIPPNNWVSDYGGTAWAWSEQRHQFYYHQFLKEQPDLNYRNDHVKEEMKEVLRLWLEKGVDGFRVNALKYLVEENDLSLDEPMSSNNPGELNHTFTTNHPETFQVLEEWHELVNQYHDKLLMVEVYSEVQDVMKYYGNDSVPLADFPFNVFMLENLTNRSLLSGYSLKDTISLWLNHMPKGKWPNWVLGNHDIGRVASRLGKDLVDALNMVLLLLPGTPITYYGEEIGMENTDISWEDTKDPEGCRWGKEFYKEHSRDPERTPMQWNDGPSAGFTSGNSTWLPINPNYTEINVAAQRNAKQSNLKLYHDLTELRQEETFTKGVLSFPTYDEDTLVS
ncbi:Maltase 1 [Chionoecetes opilio]|uniref:alpha-glucosidase n=1 Tax=Chionoecetes opilio TaxID=41210 RepID=A0A8J5CCF7_CHIOP|nr:Maltase 1 [Chionoecetes opilio]